MSLDPPSTGRGGPASTPYVKEDIPTMAQPSSRLPHLPLAGLAAFALLVGIAVGVRRLDPALVPGLVPVSVGPLSHGPLMIGGALGTLVTLERAAGSETPWGYAGPASAGLGGLALVAGYPTLAGVLLTAASLVLVLLLVELRKRTVDAALVLMVAGAAAWALGNLAWLAGVPVIRTAPLWVTFLVLVIAGERLELSRHHAPANRAAPLLYAAVVGTLVGAAVALVSLRVGVPLAGVGLAGAGAWLLRYDPALGMARGSPGARFRAYTLRLGYLWLVAGGLLWVIEASSWGAGPAYDAMLHAILLGFVFSLVFAHAPVVAQALSGVPIPHHPVLWGHVVLLHGSLALRVVGDGLGRHAWRRVGGVGNAAALILFLVVTLSLLTRSAWNRRR